MFGHACVFTYIKDPHRPILLDATYSLGRGLILKLLAYICALNALILECLRSRKN